MATIIMLLCLLVMGTFFSLAFVFAFQKKKGTAWLMLGIGFVVSFMFYWGIYKGWIAIPEQY
ncbi:hypothetical protein [Paenibacillus sp. YYML68]|uniref:hypothetical protein n=1 Tax=Paenibacillus sp. YYML68 TaxID=2909250 RepID=UPI002490969F|nr:hypothetical protein [Paenibacillus sp. YYML68]